MSTHHFSVDARALLTLGRDSIKDNVTAVLELVKNSYDADATSVSVELRVSGKAPETRCIRIADNGSGMTADAFRESWLRIGASTKRRAPQSQRSRRVTGEKGIGRLSADRLGSHLLMFTRATRKKCLQVAVDWTAFEVDGKDLASIPVSAEECTPPAELETTTGTLLEIRNLREHWRKSDIEALHSELSLLLPPSAGQSDFSIRFHNDIAEEFNGPISALAEETSLILVDAVVSRSGRTHFTIVNRAAAQQRRKSREFDLSWTDIRGQAASGNQDGETRYILGPLRIKLMFYPRTAQTIADTSLTLSDLRKFLDVNAGVRVYRDNVRVRPYGSADDAQGDWLQLAARKTQNPAAKTRTGFRIAPNQLVGYVLIGRDRNPALVDSTAREGLVDNDAFRQLCVVARRAIQELERDYTTAARELANESEPPAPERIAERIEAAARALEGLERAAKRGGVESESVADLRSVRKELRAVTQEIEDVAGQLSMLRGMATVGIAATVFAHETQSAIMHAGGAVLAARSELRRKEPEVQGALEELLKAQQGIEKVLAWANFALARARKDKRKRRKHDIQALTHEVLAELQPVFASSSIEVRDDIAPVEARIIALDYEAVLVNLLTNAHSACMRGRPRRCVSVRVAEQDEGESAGFVLSVSDTGPGVPKELRSSIWIPLVTTKRETAGRPSGIGLGLSIVDSVVREHNGSRGVGKDDALGGARFHVWLPTGLSRRD